MGKIILILVICAFSAGCITAPKKPSTTSLIVNPLVERSKQDLTPNEEEVRRNGKLAELNKRYEILEPDLQRAMSYSVYMQRKNFIARKKIGSAGALFGVIATTLNAASKANIVTSTAFTGLQTVALGYLNNEDKGYVDPFSYEQIKSVKDKLSTAFEGYQLGFLKLSTEQLSAEEWNKLYYETVAHIAKMKFEINTILPPEDVLNKENKIAGKLVSK